MDGTRGYYAKRYKSFGERQLSYLTDKRNLRNKTESLHKGGKNEKMGLGGRQTIKDLISKNRLWVAGESGDRRGWWGNGHWGG